MQSCFLPGDMLNCQMVIKMKQKLTGTAALLLATIIWGSTFVAQSVGMEYIGPFTFQSARCLLAVVFLVPVIALFEIRDPKLHKEKWLDKKLWFAGTLCGLALFVATTRSRSVLSIPMQEKLDS